MSKGLPDSMDGSSTLIDLLRRQAERQPDRLAYTFLLDGEAQEVRLSYAELELRARAVGALLQGVMLTHGNLLHNSALIHQAFAHTPQSQGVIWLPPYHDMGLIGGIIQPLYGGFPVVLLSPVDFLQRPLRWLQAVSRYRATTS